MLKSSYHHVRTAYNLVNLARLCPKPHFPWIRWWLVVPLRHVLLLTSTVSDVVNPRKMSSGAVGVDESLRQGSICEIGSQHGHLILSLRLLWRDCIAKSSWDLIAPRIIRRNSLDIQDLMVRPSQASKIQCYLEVSVKPFQIVFTNPSDRSNTPKTLK